MISEYQPIVGQVSVPMNNKHAITLVHTLSEIDFSPLGVFGKGLPTGVRKAKCTARPQKQALTERAKGRHATQVIGTMFSRNDLRRRGQICL